METILLKILEVQNEILAELRQLRQAISQGAPLAAASQPAPLDAVAPVPTPAPTASASPEIAPPSVAPSPPQPGGRLTVNELADIGGQFLDAGSMPRGKVKSVDASDLSHSLLDDIKAKNKAKRSAFAEFEKFGRDR